MPILHFIRRILTVLKGNLLPKKPPLEYTLPTPHEMYIKEQHMSSYNHFKKYFKDAIFLNAGKEFRKYSIKKAIENDKNSEKFYLEFGVYKGKTINLFSTLLKNEIYGFDSFEGLREDEKGHTVGKGALSLDGNIPKLNKNVVPIKGWIQDTLPQFLKEKKPKINFVHIDLDTYESSKFALANIKPYLSEKCIILFDELYNYSGWDVNEYKALSEVFNEDEYKYLAFSSGCQVCIQMKN